MSCNPFNTGHNIWDSSFDRVNIVVKDGSSLAYVAKNELKQEYNVFKVDSGILPQAHDRKSCDFLLLKCPNEQSNITGCLFFIECKSSANLSDAYKQLKDSFIRVKAEFPNLFRNYPQFYFRVCGKRATQVYSSDERAIINLYPKGVFKEIHLITRVFSNNPEILN